MLLLFFKCSLYFCGWFLDDSSPWVIPFVCMIYYFHVWTDMIHLAHVIFLFDPFIPHLTLDLIHLSSRMKLLWPPPPHDDSVVYMVYSLHSLSISRWFIFHIRASLSFIYSHWSISIWFIFTCDVPSNSRPPHTYTPSCFMTAHTREVILFPLKDSSVLFSESFSNFRFPEWMLNQKSVRNWKIDIDHAVSYMVE